MSENRFMLLASVHVLFIKENKILLSLRKNITSDGLYGLVAGHVEEGETITQAFIRESKEEVGVDVLPENLEIKTVCHSLNNKNGKEFIQFYAICKEWSGELINNEEDKCAGIEFFSVDELPQNMVPYIRVAIENIMNNIQYFEYGWNGEE